MPFDVDDNEIDHGTTYESVREKAHRGLDLLLDALDEGAGGGEYLISDVHSDDKWRMTLCIFSNETICVWCNGTGIEGS